MGEKAGIEDLSNTRLNRVKYGTSLDFSRCSLQILFFVHTLVIFVRQLREWQP